MIEGEYFDGEGYVRHCFKPSPEDIQTLRTYKQIDLTARGTLEFRSACTQPFSEAMTVAAFHLGLSSQTEALAALLKNNEVLYANAGTPRSVRERFNRRDGVTEMERPKLRALTECVLLLAEKGDPPEAARRKQP